MATVVDMINYSKISIVHLWPVLKDLTATFLRRHKCHPHLFVTEQPEFSLTCCSPNRAILTQTIYATSDIQLMTVLFTALVDKV